MPKRRTRSPRAGVVRDVSDVTVAWTLRGFLKEIHGVPPEATTGAMDIIRTGESDGVRKAEGRSERLGREMAKQLAMVDINRELMEDGQMMWDSDTWGTYTTRFLELHPGAVSFTGGSSTHASSVRPLTPDEVSSAQATGLRKPGGAGIVFDPGADYDGDGRVATDGDYRSWYTQAQANGYTEPFSVGGGGRTF